MKFIILLLLFSLAMVSRTQNYHARVVEFDDLNAFILQKEAIRKELIELAFNFFGVDFSNTKKGLDDKISQLTTRTTRSMPQSVRDCLISEKVRMTARSTSVKIRIDGQNLNEILYHFRTFNLGVDTFILQEWNVRNELILLVFEHFNIGVNKTIEATLLSLTNAAVKEMPNEVKECLASEILRMKGKNIDDILLFSKLNDDVNFDTQQKEFWFKLTGVQCHWGGIHSSDSKKIRNRRIKRRRKAEETKKANEVKKEANKGTSKAFNIDVRRVSFEDANVVKNGATRGISQDEEASSSDLACAEEKESTCKEDNGDARVEDPGSNEETLCDSDEETLLDFACIESNGDACEEDGGGGNGDATPSSILEVSTNNTSSHQLADESYNGGCIKGCCARNQGKGKVRIKFCIPFYLNRIMIVV